MPTTLNPQGNGSASQPVIAPTSLNDAVVLVNGWVKVQDDRVCLIANELVVPDFSSAQPDRPLAVSLPTRQCTIDKVSALKQVLARHPGTSQVHLRLISGERITNLELDPALRVTPSPALMGDLKALLGPGVWAARSLVTRIDSARSALCVPIL